NRMFNNEENSFQRLIRQYIAGANAHHPDALFGKPCPTPLIVAHHSGAIMRAAIHLDRQPDSRTVEIQNVRSDGVLSAKAHARQLSFPHCLPEQDLRQAHVAPQLASAAECFVGRPHPPPPCSAWSPSPAPRGRTPLYYLLPLSRFWSPFAGTTGR